MLSTRLIESVSMELIEPLLISFESDHDLTAAKRESLTGVASVLSELLEPDLESAVRAPASLGSTDLLFDLAGSVIEQA